MATLTAQILIGEPHPNHDGINPTHYLYLSENSRPAWVLVHQNIFVEGQNNNSDKITWIPTVENMLEDALLMIAICICKDKQVIELGSDYYEKIESDRVELYTNLDERQRKLIYQKCRDIENFPKIIITTFKGSSIENQLSILELYKMDVEVCTPSYSRLFSRWGNKTNVEGSLA